MRSILDFMTSTTLVVMGPGDEPRIESFLGTMADISMLLRSNLQSEGLRDDGRTLQGTWLAAVDGAQRIVGVAAHFHLGTMVLAAPDHAGELSVACVAASRRRLAGLLGPWAQVRAARLALGLQATPAQLDSPELLFALDLSELIQPPALQAGQVSWRLAREEERALLVDWRIAFHLETLGAANSDETRSAAADEIDQSFERTSLYVLSAEGNPVSCSSIIARLPDMVSVGGVWTPPALRGRGYARAIVAASLLHERSRGVQRAVLFTNHNNPAQRAYRAIGFREVGDYGLILW